MSVKVPKKRVTVVIIDLDNTLYDWVEMWCRSFSAMLSRLVQDSGIDQETLEREFKQIHQEHETAEYAFSIQELPSLRQKFPNEDLVRKFKVAISAYDEARSASLRLYPKVSQTLRTLKSKGCLIVGFTESKAFYTNYRVRRLELDGLLDYVYSPKDHPIPKGLTRKKIRSHPPGHYELHRTIHRYTPEGVRKPNPNVLIDILRDVGATNAEAIYVGDSLTKDIGMAQSAGVTDVYAKYGVAHERPEYELLRRVTNWTTDEVDNEKKTKESDIVPSYVLDNDCGQLLEIFEFSEYVKPVTKANALEKQLIVRIWKETVDIQAHFNDLELRIRNYAVTLFVAVLGAAGFALNQKMYMSVFGSKLPLATILLIGELLAWGAFYFMDRHWYHRLLLGAVQQGTYIEERWRLLIPELKLTQSISKASPMTWGKFTMHSSRKLTLFYLVIALVIIAMILGVSWGFVGGQTEIAQNSTSPMTSTLLRTIVLSPKRPCSP